MCSPVLEGFDLFVLFVAFFEVVFVACVGFLAFFVFVVPDSELGRARFVAGMLYADDCASGPR